MERSYLERPTISLNSCKLSKKQGTTGGQKIHISHQLMGLKAQSWQCICFRSDIRQESFSFVRYLYARANIENLNILYLIETGLNGATWKFFSNKSHQSSTQVGAWWIHQKKLRTWGYSSSIECHSQWIQICNFSISK